MPNVRHIFQSSVRTHSNWCWIVWASFHSPWVDSLWWMILHCGGWFELRCEMNTRSTLVDNPCDCAIPITIAQTFYRSERWLRLIKLCASLFYSRRLPSHTFESTSPIQLWRKVAWAKPCQPHEAWCSVSVCVEASEYAHRSYPIVSS